MKKDKYTSQYISWINLLINLDKTTKIQYSTYEMISSSWQLTTLQQTDSSKHHKYKISNIPSNLEQIFFIHVDQPACADDYLSHQCSLPHMGLQIPQLFNAVYLCTKKKNNLELTKKTCKLILHITMQIICPKS